MTFKVPEKDYTIDSAKPTSKEQLFKTLNAYERQLADIDQSNLFTHSATLSQELQKAHNEILSQAITAEFYLNTHDFSIGREKMIMGLEKRIEQLEKELKESENYALNHLQALATSPGGPLVLKEAKESYLKSKRNSIRQSVQLSLSKKLKKDLEEKNYEDVKKDFDEKAKGSIAHSYIDIYNAAHEWVEAKDAFASAPSTNTRHTAITKYLETLIKIQEHKIANADVKPSKKKDTVYWKALHKGQEVILPESQIQYIPVEDRKNELQRQKDSLKPTVFKNFVAASVNTFLWSLGGADLSVLMGGGDTVSQIGNAMLFGLPELAQLLPDKEEYKQIKSFVGASEEDPTGNSEDGMDPKEHALLSSQAMHCAQILDHYKPYYDMKTYEGRSMVPVYKKDKNGNELPGQYEVDIFPEDSKNPSKKLEESVIGIANRALIDELGITGETDEEKYSKLQQIIALAQGETMEARAKRHADKAAALKDAQASIKKEEEKALEKAETNSQRKKIKADMQAKLNQEKDKIEQKYPREIRGGLQAELDATKTAKHMDLITPLPNRVKPIVKPGKVGYSSDKRAFRDHLEERLKHLDLATPPAA